MAEESAFDVKSNLRQVLADLKEFDPKLATELRRRLRGAGEDAIKAMGDILDSEGAGSGRGKGIQSRGSRQEIKRGLRLRVTAGKTRTTARLVSTAGDLRKPMNAKSWRHPVFGTGVFVDQRGTGYFNRGATGQRDAIARNMQEAVNEALEAAATRSPKID